MIRDFTRSKHPRSKYTKWLSTSSYLPGSCVSSNPGLNLYHGHLRHRGFSNTSNAKSHLFLSHISQFPILSKQTDLAAVLRIFAPLNYLTLLCGVFFLSRTANYDDGRDLNPHSLLFHQRGDLREKHLPRVRYLNWGIWGFSTSVIFGTSHMEIVGWAVFREEEKQQQAPPSRILAEIRWREKKRSRSRSQNLHFTYRSMSRTGLFGDATWRSDGSPGKKCRWHSHFPTTFLITVDATFFLLRHSGSAPGYHIKVLRYVVLGHYTFRGQHIIGSVACNCWTKR